MRKVGQSSLEGVKSLSEAVELNTLRVEINGKIFLRVSADDERTEHLLQVIRNWMSEPDWHKW